MRWNRAGQLISLTSHSASSHVCRRGESADRRGSRPPREESRKPQPRTVKSNRMGSTQVRGRYEAADLHLVPSIAVQFSNWTLPQSWKKVQEETGRWYPQERPTGPDTRLLVLTQLHVSKPQLLRVFSNCTLHRDRRCCNVVRVATHNGWNSTSDLIIPRRA